MADIELERGKELTYPNFYPKLTFTPIFGHRGDFIWIEEVIGAWPEHDSEFTFVRSAVHDQRVDRLRADNDQLAAENAKLRELVRDMHAVISDRNSWWDCMCKDTRRFADRMRELGIEVDG